MKEQYSNRKNSLDITTDYQIIDIVVEKYAKDVDFSPCFSCTFAPEKKQTKRKE